MTEQRGEGSRRWTWLIGATLALVSIVPTGCDSDGNPFVMSLQPFYTPVDLEADSRLNETWIDKEGDVTFAFEQGRAKGKEKEYEKKRNRLVSCVQFGFVFGCFACCRCL